MVRNFQHWAKYAVLVLVGSIAGIASVANAALIPGLPLTPNPPDVFSTVTAINYNSASGAFSVTGDPAGNLISFDMPGGVPNVPEIGFIDFGAAPVPSFAVQVFIDSAGLPVAGGTGLLIQGTIPSLPLPDSGTLLAGVLEEVGYFQENAGSGIFQLVFGSLSGDLTIYYTDKAVVYLSAVDQTTLYDGDFNNSFSFSGRLLNADTSGVVVPEPSSAALLLLSSMGFVLVRRMRTGKQSS